MKDQDRTRVNRSVTGADAAVLLCRRLVEQTHGQQEAIDALAQAERLAIAGARTQLGTPAPAMADPGAHLGPQAAGPSPAAGAPGFQASPHGARS